MHEVIEPTMTILEYGTQEAAIHAAERVRLERMGQALPFVDAAIAAIAVSHALPLVTRNTSDFAAFSGLTVENWFL